MTKGFSGGCLCGAVRFSSTAEPMFVGHCHCVDCRKSSGTGHSTHILVPELEFSVTGPVTFYDHPADSGNIVSRGFCGTCGSPIYSRNSGMPGVVFPQGVGAGRSRNRQASDGRLRQSRADLGPHGFLRCLPSRSCLTTRPWWQWRKSLAGHE